MERESQHEARSNREEKKRFDAGVSVWLRIQCVTCVRIIDNSSSPSPSCL